MKYIKQFFGILDEGKIFEGVKWVEQTTRKILPSDTTWSKYHVNCVIPKEILELEKRGYTGGILRSDTDTEWLFLPPEFRSKQGPNKRAIDNIMNVFSNNVAVLVKLNRKEKHQNYVVCASGKNNKYKYFLVENFDNSDIMTVYGPYKYLIHILNNARFIADSCHNKTIHIDRKNDIPLKKLNLKKLIKKYRV